MILNYLAARRRTTVAELIRLAVIEKYRLDAADLRKEAASFFESDERRESRLSFEATTKIEA